MKRMTYDEIVAAALERAAVFGDTGGMPKESLFRRLSLRQSQWFQRSSTLSPDFFGVCVVGLLVNGALDLEDIAPPDSPIGRVERIEIADPGTSGFAALQEVTVVPLNDPAAGLVPRCTLRELVVRSVGNDLAGVRSLRIYYTKQAREVSAADGALEAEIRWPYVDLLVLDLAQFVLKQMAARGVPNLEGAMKLLAEEEEALGKDFESHITSFVLNPADRFRRFGIA